MVRPRDAQEEQDEAVAEMVEEFSKWTPEQNAASARLLDELLATKSAPPSSRFTPNPPPKATPSR